MPEVESKDIHTVLVVDDAPENIDILSGILRDDYYVKAARNGEIALNIINSKSTPDIVLLDIMMPGNDGYEVCRRIKSDPETSHIPVIFVSSMIGIDDEIRGLKMGAADYIIKPFSPPIVKLRVRNHLALYDRRRELKQRVEQTISELQDTQQKLIQRLGRASEYKDNETGLHVVRMGHYSRILGLATGMSESEAEMLMEAASIHDIGKIGLPDNILMKPRNLDDSELDIIKTHCEIGAEIIGDDSSELLQLAKVIALTHHEKWNGSGYPVGLAGEEIPLAGRIVAIADVFDALTSERPYKEAWPVDKAIELLETVSGEHFDPQLVPLFLYALPKILKIKDKFAEK